MKFFRSLSKTKEIPAPPPEAIRFEGNFPSFEQAILACNGSAGYESKEAIDRYIRRYIEVRDDPAKAIMQASDQVLRFMAAFSLARPIDGVVRVYDLGGGYGAIYDLFRHLYPGIGLKWFVVEVPELVSKASEMGASDEKQFVTEIPDGPFSLGISSGTLQYMRDPDAGLASMIRSNAAVTMLNRVPLWDMPDRLMVQHVPAAYFKASFPARIFSNSWRAKFDALGEKILEWKSPGDTIDIDGARLDYSAFIYRQPLP